ncbi:MAG TPA: hypothetical protein VKQ30_20740 [Ktedonobacterales bacterium]|nr:hypothetical protein [Ktedonobacterales bacterium]
MGTIFVVIADGCAVDAYYSVADAIRRVNELEGDEDYSEYEALGWESTTLHDPKPTRRVWHDVDGRVNVEGWGAF